ncbi:MAG: tetratricopeptide repeat protein [Myxococcota bacterium]|nr:tetratricopeptide repeat protein [Myxococcota bacterium]
MNWGKENRCACCGAPVKPGTDMCKVCARDATAKTQMLRCRACGMLSPSRANACLECGAPLAVPPQEPQAEETAVGRQPVLQALEDGFALSLESRRGIGVIISGQAGMGVTTLLRAFAASLSGRLPAERIRLVSARSDGDAFAVLRDILIPWLGLQADKDPEAKRAELVATVGRVLGPVSDAIIKETSHLIGYLVGLPFSKSPVLKSILANQGLLHRRLAEVLVHYIKTELKRDPAVLLLDDMHLASVDARRFTLNILGALGEVPLVVVIGGRPEVNAIANHLSMQCITLEPLDDAAMHQLFSKFMPQLTNPPEDLVNAAVGRASGNPGSLNQLVALLIESGVVNTQTDPWTADVSKLAMPDMPVGLIDTFKARVAQLDPRDRAVLEYAAIIGEVFWDEAIVALSRQQVRLKKNISAAQIWSDDSDSLAISSSLDRLVERQFVVPLPERDIEGCIKYAFARSGIRGEIVDSIAQKKLQLGHMLAAEWLAQVSNKAGNSFCEAEAAHWTAAGQDRQATYAYFKAARFAQSRFLNIKAIKLFKRGIELADVRDRFSVADALHDLGSLYDLLGEYEKAERCFTDMLRHAWILMNRGKAGAALNRIGRLYSARGDSDAARAFLNRGMVLFRSAGDEKGVAACLGDLGELARRQGSYDRAFQLVNEALALQRKIENTRSIAVCLHRLGHIEAARASYAQAEGYLEEALSFHREANEKRGMAQTLSTLAMVLSNRGDLDRAIARLEAALNIAEEVGDRRMQAFVNNSLGEALRDQGKLDQSMAHFKSCEALVSGLDDCLLHSEVSRNIGILARSTGDLPLSRQYLKHALDLAREGGGKEMEGLALRALGELESTTMWDTSNVGKPDTAEMAFDKATAIFSAIGNDFELARTLHARGNRHLERGDVAGGKAMLEQAEQIFKRIDSKAGDKIGRTINEIMDHQPQLQAGERKKSTTIPPPVPSAAIKVERRGRSGKRSLGSQGG